MITTENDSKKGWLLLKKNTKKSDSIKKNAKGTIITKKK